MILVIVEIVKVILFLMVVLSVGGLLSWVERRMSGFIQDRLGPNRANVVLFGRNITIGGLLHPVADGLKMLFKEDFVPEGAHRILFVLAPFLAMLFVLMGFASIPFAQSLNINGYEVRFFFFDFDVGMLFIFAVSSLSIFGAILGGYSSNNKWALLGGVRAAAQLISYEVVIGLGILSIVIVYNSLSVVEILQKQDSILFGFLPNWGIFIQPLSFILIFVALLAEGKRAPFDIPEGESEIIGYFVEYSGLKFAMFFLSEFIEIIFIAAIITLLFLGGYHLPYLSSEDYINAVPFVFLVFGILPLSLSYFAFRYHKSVSFFLILLFIGIASLIVSITSLFVSNETLWAEILVRISQMLVFSIKTGLVTFLLFSIRWTFPRYRFDQLLKISWEKLVPISILNILLTGFLLL
ncbi:MAG: NADH-quinone oxidoreductase subunit H [Deltaproteobacteria bacterium]|nr:NADH-quinone oxidoreductase subunit H [Deltaproteobacteria bacterium]